MKNVNHRNQERKMEAHIITLYVLVILCQATVIVNSEDCSSTYSYFYCCGDCEDDGTGQEMCVTDEGIFYVDTYSCGTYYYYYYSSKISIGAIIGIVIGCLTGLGIIVSVSICVCIKCCRTQPSSTTGHVIHAYQLSGVTTNNTQGHIASPAQGETFPTCANRQETTSHSINTVTDGMSNAYCDFEKNYSGPPPSYEQVATAPQEHM